MRSGFVQQGPAWGRFHCGFSLYSVACYPWSSEQRTSRTTATLFSRPHFLLFFRSTDNLLLRLLSCRLHVLRWAWTRTIQQTWSIPTFGAVRFPPFIGDSQHTTILSRLQRFVVVSFSVFASLASCLPALGTKVLLVLRWEGGHQNFSLCYEPFAH